MILQFFIHHLTLTFNWYFRFMDKL